MATKPPEDLLKQLDEHGQVISSELTALPDRPAIYTVTVDEELRDDFELLTAYYMVPIDHKLNYGGRDVFKIACAYDTMVAIDDMFEPGDLEWKQQRHISSREKQSL